MREEKAIPLDKAIEPAYRLWTRGNVARARAEARRALAANPGAGAREQAERLLQDTAPDPRAVMAGVAAIAIVAVVLLLIFTR